MLKQILSSVGGNVHLHIADVPDIAPPTKISTTSSSNTTNPPTYERLHIHLLLEKVGNKNWFHTRNI